MEDLRIPYSGRATPAVEPGDAIHPVDRPRGRMGRVLHEEFQGLHLRLLLLRIVLWPLPMNVGGRLRALAMKLAGFRIGYGTIFAQLPTFTGDGALYGHLRVGGLCWFNVGCFFDLGAPVTVGHNVSFGQQVMVLTSSHVIGPSGRRAAGLVYKPVTIGSGAWLGARCTILPGVSIGDGAIVAAGAVVHQDVPANVLVAGVPARIVRSLRVATR
jgi:maltose O-acetyltransferase